MLLLCSCLDERVAAVHRLQHAGGERSPPLAPSQAGAKLPLAATGRLRTRTAQPHERAHVCAAADGGHEGLAQDGSAKTNRQVQGASD